jgi:hypothetical protein
MLYSKEALQKLLREGVSEITFTKTNGETRVMKCTLSSQYITDDGFANSTRKQNPDVLSVWDVDLGEWRSFRLENVTTVRMPLFG